MSDTSTPAPAPAADATAAADDGAAAAPAPAAASDSTGGGGAGGGAGAKGGDGADGGGEEAADGYKAPAKKATLEEVLNRKEEDESLEKYKAALLGGAAAAINKDDPRQVIIESVDLLPQDRDPIVLKMGNDKEIKELAAARVVVKEGAKYKVRVVFRVQNEPVLGLKLVQKVYKMGLNVLTDNFVIGSYAPKAEAYTYTSNLQQWPSGFFARGSYSSTLTVTDDDKQEHVKAETKIDIKKQWPK